MAKFSNVNTSPATGSVAMYNFKEVLKSAGWTVPSSSDGTTYNSSGDQITGGGSGANGMANSRAWFRIQDPGARREYVVQKSTSGNQQWRIKYSALAKFTGGSPAATVTPDATDEGFLLGAGSSASPTFATLYTTDATYKHHTIAQSTVEGNVYPFWAFTNTSASSAINHAFFCEPMDANYSSASDQDPCVMMATSVTGTGWTMSNFASLVFGWYKFNVGGAAFISMPALQITDYSGFIAAPGLLGTNPYDSTDNSVPMIWGRCSAMGTNTGPKGFSKYLKWKFTSRVYPDSVNLASDAYVYVTDVLVPWPNSVTPLT